MKNDIFKFSTIILAGLSLSVGLSMNQPAQAATNFKRTKTTKISRKYFYSTCNTGKTYKFVGSTKNFHFKANHALKNYKHSTWVASGKTTVTKHGKKYTYYTVKNTKNGATGWVTASYLKSGKDFMMSSVKNTSKSNQVMKKSGKVYQLKGNSNHVAFTKGKSLSAKMTYVASQKRTIYKSGKAYTYYYVTSKDNKTVGWVWSGFVRAGTYKAPTTSGTTTTKQSTGNNTNTNNGSATSSSSAATGQEAYNANAVASDFVQLLNQARAAKGRPALEIDGVLTTIGNIRAQQLSEEMGHTYKGVNTSTALAKQYGIYDSYYATEDVADAAIHDTNMATAEDILASWDDAHRADLMNASFSKIGVGLYHEPGNNGMNGDVAIQLGF